MIKVSPKNEHTEVAWRVKYVLRTMAAVLILLILWSVFAAVSIVLYAGRDDAAPADVIIVLGAGTNGYAPSPVFRERLNHAVMLYLEGYADTILLTGGLSPGNAHSDAAIAGQYLQSRGIPVEDILLEEQSTITQENLEYAKQIMDTEGLATAILVSDPLHMKRAMLMANDYEIEAFSSPTPTTRYQTWKSKLPFLMRELFFYTGYLLCRPFF